MNLKNTFTSIFLLSSIISFSQEKKENFFYATLESQHAEELKLKFPKQIDIIQSKNNLSSVYMDSNITHELHQKILSHGPGYLFHSTKEQANLSLKQPNAESKIALNYSISEQEYVNKILDEVNEKKIEEVVLMLEAYGTRYHLREQANLAAEDLKLLWEKMIKDAGRENDVSVRIINHQNTPMKSVALTIIGNSNPSEYVIIGGHLDSIISGSTQASAPGADDNASGIATITEVLRVLLANNFYPEKTVEMMAYAAEEIGLVGSNEIATSYKNDGKNIYAYVQFDMTGYKGSVDDIYITTDTFINNNLNLFLFDLMEEYNKSGKHQFTYNTTKCNYGCSDHYSWGIKGFPAAFPFEASFEESSNFIHSVNDTYANMGNSTAHSAKFVKLGLEFVVEAAKRKSTLSVNDVKKTQAKFYVDNKIIGFEVESNSKINKATIINISGQKVSVYSKLKSKDQIHLNHLPKGAYILVLETQTGNKISHKFLLN